jgi:hypothetical protein
MPSNAFPARRGYNTSKSLFAITVNGGVNLGVAFLHGKAARTVVGRSTSIAKGLYTRFGSACSVSAQAFSVR